MNGEPIIGIDLGTTFSLVALADARGPYVLRDEAGEARVPSVLGIAPTTVAAQSQIEATLSLIREREKSGIVVIVSHSDIVPGFLKALGHPGQITIGPREHDDIFVIVPAPGGPPTVVRLNY